MKTIVVQITVENSSERTLTRVIPRGTVIEVADPRSDAQSATVTRDYAITLPPGQETTVYLEAMCLENWKDWPTGQPGRLTPYCFQGPFADQDDLWGQIS